MSMAKRKGQFLVFFAFILVAYAFMGTLQIVRLYEEARVEVVGSEWELEAMRKMLESALETGLALHLQGRADIEEYVADAARLVQSGRLARIEVLTPPTVVVADGYAGASAEFSIFYAPFNLTEVHAHTAFLRADVTTEWIIGDAPRLIMTIALTSDWGPLPTADFWFYYHNGTDWVEFSPSVRNMLDGTFVAEAILPIGWEPTSVRVVAQDWRGVVVEKVVVA